MSKKQSSKSITTKKPTTHSAKEGAKVVTPKTVRKFQKPTSGTGPKIKK